MQQPGSDPIASLPRAHAPEARQPVPPQAQPAAPEHTASHAPDTALISVQRGVMRALPMTLGYVPLGFAFGVLALGLGVSGFNTMLMSCLVYAGSAQILATQLLASGGNPLSVVMTTFIVNLRHLLMSASLAPHLRAFSKKELALFGFSLSDEAFALHSAGLAQRPEPKLESFAINASLHLAWIVGTALAFLIRGDASDFLVTYGLDYAPAAMFIALLVLMVKDKVQLVVATLAGVAAVAFQLWHWGAWSVLAATLLAASVGLAGETWIKNRSA